MSVVEVDGVQADAFTGETVLTLDEATALTEQIRGKAGELWKLVREAHDRKAWIPLGYKSFTDYGAAEFNMGKSQAYRLLELSRVMDVLEAAESPMGENLSERKARELAPLLDEPEKLVAVAEEVLSDEKATAADARKQERQIRAEERRAAKLTDAEQLDRLIENGHGHCKEAKRLREAS